MKMIQTPLSRGNIIGNTDNLAIVLRHQIDIWILGQCILLEITLLFLAAFISVCPIIIDTTQRYYLIMHMQLTQLLLNIKCTLNV